MKNFLINLLLGNSKSNLYNIQYLFGATQMSHDQRKKRWEKALARLWRDKDMLDFLYYQAENDKENSWKGRIKKELSQGARIRTLFIVKSAHLAYRNQMKRGKTTPDEVGHTNQEMDRVEKSYQQITKL
jgi:hypothetical protein